MTVKVYTADSVEDKEKYKWANDFTKVRLGKMVDEHRIALAQIKEAVADEIYEFNETWDENVDGYDNGVLAGRNEFAEQMKQLIQKLEVEYNVL